MAGGHYQEKNWDETKPSYPDGKSGGPKGPAEQWPEKPSTQRLVVEQEQIDGETN
jgi:hypothetical protein